MKIFKRLRARPSDPVVVDRWLDVAYIALWLCYGGWGIFSLIVGLPTVYSLASDWYQTVWSGMIGILSLTAAFMASLSFFETSWFSLMSKKRWERGAVIALTAFVSVYPALLVIRAAGGEISIVGPSSILSLSYVVFPVLRIWILRNRILGLRKALVDAS